MKYNRCKLIEEYLNFVFPQYRGQFIVKQPTSGFKGNTNGTPIKDIDDSILVELNSSKERIFRLAIISLKKKIENELDHMFPFKFEVTIRNNNGQIYPTASFLFQKQKVIKNIFLYKSYA